MDIFSLSAHLGLDRSEYESGIQDARASFTDLGDHIENVAKRIVAALALKEAFNGLKSLVSAATDAFAEYEQLAGGVETLFGTSADTIKAYAQQAYQTAGMSANEYMSTVTSFAASLIQGVASGTSQSTTITKEAADEQYQATKAGYDAQVAAAQEAFTAQYNALKTSLDSRYKALQKALNKEYNARQKALQKQYEAASQAAEDEIEAYSDSLNKRLEKLQASQEKEVEAFNKATDKKLKAIDKEYQATLRRIDKERAARLKAIDDELAALDKEKAEKDKANRDAERETTKQRLQEAVQWAKTVGERVNAQNKLNDYLEQIRIEDEEDARQSRIDELKAQKEQVQDEAKTEEDAAKKKHDKATNQIKTQRAAQLKAIQAANKKELKAMQESNAASLKQFRRAKQAQLKALQEHNQEELSSLRESQQNQLESVQASNAAQLASTKKAQQDKLKAMKAAHTKELKELKKALKAQQEEVAKAGEKTPEVYERAADISNMAIQDMADIAATFGDPIENIADVYKSLSKGMYQTLDNLHLPFAGTKQGMEDLLKEAERLSGRKFDIGNISDVYEAIHEVLKDMRITGRAEKEASKTVEGSMNATKAAWQNLMIAMGRGEGVGDAMKNLTGSFKNLAKNIIPVVKQVLRSIGEALHELGPIIIRELPGILDEISPKLGDMVRNLFAHLPGIIEGLKTLFDRFGPAVIGAVVAFTAFKKALDFKDVLDKVMTGVKALFTLIRAHPAALIVTAIGAVIGTLIHLYNTNEDFRNKVNEVWETVKTAVLDAWEQHIKPALEAIATFFNDTLVPAVKDAWEQHIQPALDAAWKFLTETVGPAIKAVWDDIINPILIALWTAISEDIIPIVKDLWETHLKPFGEWVAGVFKDAWDNLVTLWNEVFLPALEALKTGIQDIWVNVVKPLANFLITGFKNAWKGISDFWENVLSPALTILQEALKAFWDEVITPLATFLTETFIAAWKELSTFWTETLQPKLTELSTAFSDFLETYIKPIADYISGLFTDAWNGIINLFGGEEGVTAIISGVKTAFSNLWNKMLKPVAEYLAGGFADAWNGIKVVIKGLLDFVTKVFKTDWKSAWTSITTSFGNIFGKIVDKVKGPINKVIGFLNGLIGKVESTINTIINGINGALTISIPSFGQWIDLPDWMGGSRYIGFPGYDWSPNMPTINWGRIPELAEGGIVKNGGHAIVGEGEYPEYLRVVNGQAVVTPMKGVERPGGDNIVINIYQQPGESHNALVDRIERDIARKELRRRAATR